MAGANYGAILSVVGVQVGPLVLVVLAVGAVLLGLYAALFGVDRVLGLVTGEDKRFEKRYDQEVKRSRKAKAAEAEKKRYDEYALRRERRAANRGW